MTTTTLNITARRIYSESTFSEETDPSTGPVAGYSYNWDETFASLLEFTLPSDFSGATINSATLEMVVTEYGELGWGLKTAVGIPNSAAAFGAIDYFTVALHPTVRSIVGSDYVINYGGSYDAELTISGVGNQSVSLNLLAALQAAVAAGHTAGGKVYVVWREQDYDPNTWGDGWHSTGSTGITLELDYTPVPLSLSGPTVVRVGETIEKTIHRTGSTASDLTVTLSQSPSGRLDIPATVTILTGETGEAFDVEGLTEGEVTLTATAGADEAEQTITVYDGELWTPASLGTSLWMDGSDSSTVFDATSGGSTPAANGTIARWEDRSGNARHATQLTNASRPTRQTSVQNGLDVVRFAGVDDHLLLPNFLGAFTAGACFLVAKNLHDPVPSTNAGLDFGGSPLGDFGSDALTGAHPWTDGIIYDDFLTTSRKVVGNPSPSLAEWYVYDVVSAASDWRAYINGSLLFSTGTNTVGKGTAPRIGNGVHSSGTYHWAGDIAEIIILSSAPTTEVRQMVEGYLAHKWGLTEALAGDHPYKAIPPVTTGIAPAILFHRRQMLGLT